MRQQELIKYCQKGDPKYQRILVDTYAGILMATCLRYCKSEDDAKDCLQEAWIKIFKAIHTYENTGSFKAWMQKIVINCALVNYRKRASIIRIESSNKSKHFEPKIYAEMSAREILDLLHRLSDIKRFVFLLFVVDGYRHSEIAEMLEISESTSRSILTRARSKLKKLITCYDKALEL